MSRKIVVLGNSVAGAMALEEIRKQDAQAELTIVGFDGYYPHDKSFFTDLVSKNISASQIFYKSKDFYEKNNIKVITDQVISRINLKRNKIFTEDKTQIDFDILIVGETSQEKFPDIKGVNKTGVYNLNKLKDVDTVIKSEVFTDTIAIEADSPEAFSFAISLLKKGKEVYFITAKPYLLSDYIEDDVAQWILKSVADLRLKIICDNQIAEILGDSDAKAIRLKTGKVVAAPMVIFENTKPDLRLFADSDLKITDKIIVDENYMTNLAHIFAVDTVALNEGSDSASMAKTVAAKVLGQQAQVSGTVPERNLKLFDYPVCILGTISSQNGAEAQRTFSAEGNFYKKIFIKEATVKAGILINLAQEKEQLAQTIKDKTPVVSAEAASSG